MLLNLRTYQIKKIKTFFKNNELFFFFNGNHSNNWLTTEQNFKNLTCNYFKVYNKTTKTLIKNSVYNNIFFLIKSLTFFIKLTKQSKTLILNSFEILSFVLLAVKLNNKIYSIKQLKKLNSLKYKDNKLIFYQLILANLKYSHKIN